MKTPLISVVVPFRNRVDEVAACAKSLLRQTLQADDYEIILVDNLSTDDLTPLKQVSGVRVVRCARLGAAAARNDGVKSARGSIIAFTDSDCLARRDWLEQLTRPLLNEPSVVATGGKLIGRRMNNGVAFFTQVYKIIDQKKFFFGSPQFPPFFATANTAWRKNAIESVGGFDEQLWPCEDADLSWRVLQNGGTIAYVPQAVVSHRHRETFIALFKQAIDYGSAGPKLHAKHRDNLSGRPRIDWMPWLLLAIQPFLAVRQLLFDRRRVFRTWFVYESVWLTGYLFGRMRETIRQRNKRMKSEG